MGLGVGDTIAFERDADDDSNGSDMKYLNCDTFVVTALVDSPEYIALSHDTYGYSTSATGAVDALAWICPSDFKADAFYDGYPIVNVRCAALADLNSFASNYNSTATPIKDRIEKLGENLAATRFNALNSEARKQIDTAEQQLADGKAQIEDGEQKIKDGEAELEEGKATFAQQQASGEAQLSDAYRQLMAGEDMKEQGGQALALARSAFDSAKAALEQADAVKAQVQAAVAEANATVSDLDEKLAQGEITQEEYDAALDQYCAQVKAKFEPIAAMAGVEIPNVDHTNIKSVIAEVQTKLDDFENLTIEYEGQTITVHDARNMLAEAESQLQALEEVHNNMVAQLESGWSQYYAGLEQYNRMVAEAEERIAQAEADIATAKQTIAEAKTAYQQKVTELDKAKQRVAEMKELPWTILGRSSNGGCVKMEIFSGITNNLSFSMAALFVIVGLLVTYSSVSRIVHEQITQIGTKKALGLRGREITTSFMMYSALAVVAGCIIGAIVGVFVVESIISERLGRFFLMSTFPPYCDWGLAIGISVIELGLVLATTWIACRGILRKQAVELLRGEEPPKLKQRFFETWEAWTKLPLYTQTIINNCINDKRRVFSTVVGVAGCTALIVTAVTLNNDVMKSYDTHYSTIYDFNAIVYVNTQNSPDQAAETLAAECKEKNEKTAAVMRKTYPFTRPDGKGDSFRLLVPSNPTDFSSVYHATTIEGGPVDLSADGIWVSEAMAHNLGMKVGDTIEIDGSDGTHHSLRIAGFYRFHLTFHEALMGAEAYEREFGSAPLLNAVFVNTGDMTVDQLEESLVDNPSLSLVVDDKERQSGSFKEFSNISGAVVLIYLALATLMAIVVLLNLNVMFISEKKRELIVLMINGYSVKDAKRYIANDTKVLTVIGIIAGIVLGCIMGSITVGAVEPVSACLVKDIDWPAVVIGAGVSAVLSLIMSRIALRRIPRFKLTDIDKL